MELSHILPWLSPTIAVAALSYTIVSNRSRARQAEFDKFREDVGLREMTTAAKVEVLEDRVSKIEGELRHLPAKDDVHQVQLALKELQGEVRGMSAQIAPIGKIADRLQEFLLDQAAAGRAR